MKTTRVFAFALLCVIFLSSCSMRYNGVTPISPTAYMPGQKNASAYVFSGLAPLYHNKPIPQVESLQPTLRWEAVAGVESYDLIICKGVPKDAQLTLRGVEHYSFEPGEEVYYREAIGKASHCVEEPLLPDSVYVWSVRTRIGTNVSAWSKYDFKTGMFRLTDVKEGRDLWWPFSTPKQ